jgi:hypothetical protein
MNQLEKRIAYLIFKNRILESDGQAYEDFFVEVMTKHNPNFEPIKPQGQIGDKKNDGFDKTTGTYYQVYAPEDLTKRENKALTKLEEDFGGLYKNWNYISPLKTFRYVLNDKYKGTYPSVHEALIALESKYTIDCKTFLNKDLENIFWEIDDNKITSIIGFLPVPDLISDIDFTILREVVEFIMKIEIDYRKESRPLNLDFHDKIQFNNLSELPANLLKVGSYQKGNVDEYFHLKSEFTKEDLRKRFVELYNDGIESLQNEVDKNDAIFFYIMESASPQKTKSVNDAVIVLMSYYFEYCDIFEPPPLK